MWKNQQQGGRWGKLAGKMTPSGYGSGFSLTKDLKHEKMAKGTARNLAENLSAPVDNYNKVAYNHTIGNSLPAPNTATDNFNRVPFQYTNISTGPNTNRTSLPVGNYNINQSSITDAINKLLPVVNAGGGISQLITNNEHILAGRNTSGTIGRNASGNADRLSLAGKSRDFSAGADNNFKSSQSGMIPDRGLGAIFGKSSNSQSQPKNQGVSSGRERDNKEPQLDRWTCIKCQYYNFQNRAKCNKCGINKSDGDGSKSKSGDKNTASPGQSVNWDCVKCQYRNFGHRSRCNKCSAPRSESAERGGKNTDKREKSTDVVPGGNVNVGIGRILPVVADGKKDGKNGVHKENNDEATKLPSEWRCIKCQSSNYHKRSTCRKCHGLRSNCDAEKNEAPKSKSDDWVCAKCHNTNFKRRTQCNRCNSNRSDFDGGKVGRDGAGGGRHPKDGAGHSELSNEQLSTALRAIEAIESMQGQSNIAIPGNDGREQQPLSWRDQRRGNNNPSFNNIQQNVPSDQLPELVRKIAAEEIANKIMEGTVPIANIAMDDQISDQVRKFAAEDIAIKIIEGRDLGGDILTHAQEQAIDQMRMMAAEEIANKILQGGVNMNMDMGNMMNIAQDINNMVMNPNMMPPAPVNIVPSVNMMAAANIMSSGVIQPVIGPNSSIMALVIPPGENPPMNIIPANNMGMNIIPPANNMILNNIPGENERINANDVFNSGAASRLPDEWRCAKCQSSNYHKRLTCRKCQGSRSNCDADAPNKNRVDSYSNYRASAQFASDKKKKTIQPVKEHPLPPKRMRRSKNARERFQSEKEAADKQDKNAAPVLDTSKKTSTTEKDSPQKATSVGKSGAPVGKRALLWAQGRAQKNLEGVSVKHVTGVKPKEKGKGKEVTATKAAATGNTPGTKKSESTSSTEKKNDDTPDATQSETTLKTGVKEKGDIIDLISDSDDDDVIDLTDEKINDNADKETLPADKSVPTEKSDTESDTEKEKETDDNTAAVKKSDLSSNPMLCIDDPDEPMYTVVDRTSDDDDMYTFVDMNPNEPTQKIPTWTDRSEFGMLGLLPQVPRPEYGGSTELVEFSDKDNHNKEKSRHHEKRRKKRKMSEKELKSTLSDMGLLNENASKTKEQIQKRGLKNPHAADNTSKTDDVVSAPLK